MPKRYNFLKASTKEEAVAPSTKQEYRHLSTNKMAASPRVSVPSENKAGECPAVQCGDPRNFSAGIIVLQEWWGLNDQIASCGQEVSDGAKAVVLVPDLYRGKVATNHEDAGHLMGDLDWKGAVDDIQGCARYLKSLGCTKVGVTGFCMGGALSMAAAALVPEIDASVPFYGICSTELADPTTIKIPLQCHFGEKDKVKGFSSPDEWKPLKEKLESHVQGLEFHTYDAEHAFTNKSSDNYHKQHADLAFSRMFQFFNKHLS